MFFDEHFRRESDKQKTFFRFKYGGDSFLTIDDFRTDAGTGVNFE